MTKTIEYKGAEYRKVNREAEVGDLIFVKTCRESPEINGRIGVCTDAHQFEADNIDVDIPTQVYGDYAYIDSDDDTYYVLTLVTESHDALQTTYGDQAPATYEIADDTPVEASPTVIDLLTNLSRRVYELEEANKPKNYEEVGPVDVPIIPTISPSDLNGKQLRTYTGEDVDDDFKTIVTVGIDDATGVMYVLGMKTEVIE